MMKLKTQMSMVKDVAKKQGEMDKTLNKLANKMKASEFELAK